MKINLHGFPLFPRVAIALAELLGGARGGFSHINIAQFACLSRITYLWYCIKPTMSTTTKHTLNPKKWVDEYADFLYNYTIGRVNNRETAKDLVQEAFLAGLQSAKNFKGEATERTWLTAILKRKIVDYYRKINSKKGQAEVKVVFYEHGDKKGRWIEENVPQIWGNRAEKNIENDELKAVLKKCIDSLPQKYNIAFNLKSIKGYTTENVCNELGITPSNLWVIIHRARHQLRDCLEKNWFKE